MIDSDIHPCNCTCDTCMDEDCAAIIAAAPRSTWTRAKLEWIRVVRMKPLNWTLEPGHCALCGGTSLSAWDMSEHDVVRRHNPQMVNGIAYLSMLIADESGWFASFKAFTKLGKDRLREWAARMMDLNEHADTGHGIGHQFACAIAVRKVENWTEIRVGFKYAS